MFLNTLIDEQTQFLNNNLQIFHPTSGKCTTDFGKVMSRQVVFFGDPCHDTKVSEPVD